MPKRSNSFQDLVEILHRLGYQDAHVEPSAMLVDRQTGEKREVDVLVLSTGMHPVRLGVEATERSRAMDMTRMEQLISKYQHLPVDRLVVVCNSGFSRNALRKAEQNDVIALQPSALTEEEVSELFDDAMKTVWAKSFEYATENFVVSVCVDGEEVEVALGPDAPLSWNEQPDSFTARDFIQEVVRERTEELIEEIKLRDVTVDSETTLTLNFEEPSAIDAGGNHHPLTIGDDDGDLHPIARLTAAGTIRFRVTPADVSYARLAEVSYGSAEFDLGQHRLVFVVTGKGEDRQIGVKATKRN